MTANWLDDRWRLHALACTSEGLCPQCHGLLSTSAGGRKFVFDDREPLNGGWCGTCVIWWRTNWDRTMIIASYPVPDDWSGVTL